MRGYTSKGLVILPPIERYLRMFPADRERFDEALRLLPAVFETNFGIKLHYFNSNIINVLPMPESMEAINCLCLGDVNYLNAVVKEAGHYGLVLDAEEQFKEDGYNELRLRVQKDNPFNQDISDAQRIKIIEKRERIIARRIAKDFALVITFEDNKNARYAIRTKKADRRTVIEVDILTMTAKGYHSGEAIDIVTLMDRSWAYKRINQWEVADNELNE